jgi:hypothetical protein
MGQVDYDVRKWWDEGLAEYLSNVVYPDTNLEWEWLAPLAQQELSTTLLEFTYENFLFFQYLYRQIGNEGIIAAIGSLSSATDIAKQQTTLAAFPSMSEIHHDFAKAKTDEDIVDTGGKQIPFKITEKNRPIVTLTDAYRIEEDLESFGVSRYRLIVEEDKLADLVFTGEGATRESARPTNEPAWREVPPALPDEDCNREYVMVVTTIEENSAFELDVPVVEDTEAACGIVGTWVVDTNSLDFSTGFFMLAYVHGQISITFNSDGTAELVYSNYEYRFTKTTQLYQEILELLVTRREEYTYTTNATGTTTYEVSGDEILFGDLFESDYLVGVEEVREVRKFEPQGIIGNNSDESWERPPGGVGLFGLFVTFELEPGGGVMRILGVNDKVDAVLYRTGSAP